MRKVFIIITLLLSMIGTLSGAKEDCEALILERADVFREKIAQEAREIRLSQRINRIFFAIVMQESRFKLNAHNEIEDAVGLAQIRPIMVREVNRLIGYNKYRLEDRWNPRKSREIFVACMNHYAPDFDHETVARIWNGGPLGPKKRSTEKYWREVQRFLN